MFQSGETKIANMPGPKRLEDATVSLTNCGGGGRIDPPHIIILLHHLLDARSEWIRFSFTHDDC